MKLKYIASIILSILIAGVSFNYKKALAKSAGAPASRSGAPTSFSGTESTCNLSGCHNSFVTNTGPGSLTIALESGGENYIPGVAQKVTVSITQANSSKFGFEAVAIKEFSDLIKIQVGEMNLSDPIRTQLLNANAISGNLAGRQYVTHTYDGNIGTNNTCEWSFLWIPPDTLTGEVGIHVSAVASNNDQEVTGDYVYTGALYLQQIPVSVHELKNEAIKVYPSFVENILNVSADESTTISIYNLQGKNVYTGVNGVGKIHDLTSLSSGQYVYVIFSDNRVLKTGKLIRKS